MCAFFAFGQEAARTITGVVRDDAGESVIGASVLLKGTTTGTVTDIDGNFSITTTKVAPVLVISYTGYASQEIQIGDGNNYEVTLAEGIEISEVVVTALGIERKKDDDLSSATLVNTKDLQRSGETGVIQGLAGKTSGVQITRNSGDPGAGAYIQIRGQNTILGSSSPLIILDGVPISNSSITAGGNGAGATAGVVQQSRLNDINPNDIASITVLKGASAAAVYGTGAANGVLVITTKSGATGNRKRFSVSVNSSVSFDQINREHAKQNVFGQGVPFTEDNFEQFGRFVPNTSLSWGDRISSRPGGPDAVNETGAYFLGNQTGRRYYPITEKRSQETFNDVNRDQVFQTGLLAELGASVNFNTNFSNTFLSFSRADQTGVIRGASDYARNTVRLNNKINLTDKLDFRLNTSWSGVSSNRIQSGSNLNGLYLGYLRTSPDFDNTDYDGQYFDASGVPRPAHRGYRRYLGDRAPVYNNPGWTIYRQTNSSNVDRFIVTPEINWTVVKGLTATARYGLDYYTDARQTFFPKNSAGDYANGGYFRDDINEKTQNLFLFVTGNYDLPSKIGLGFNVGYNVYSNQYSRQTGSANNLLVDDPTKLIFDNATLPNVSVAQALSVDQKNGVFAVVNADYDDKLFVELTGRLERTTTVDDQIFYPSASLGYKLFDDPSAAVSFAKFRASYGEVGIEPQLYLNQDVYFSSQVGQGWGDYLDGNNYGGAFRRGSTQGNPNLTIERVSEIEFGGDFRFLANKISLGLTYYDRTTRDALLPKEVPASSGYSDIYDNAAEITNKGVEIDAGYRLYASEKFQARIFANFTHNEPVVTELPDVSRVILNGFTSTSSAVVEDAAFGAIYGGRFLRQGELNDGALILTESGFPQLAEEQGVIGDPNADWRGGLGAEFNYNGVNLSFLFETSQGNDGWAGTLGVLNYFGISPETANITTTTEDLPNVLGTVYPAGTTFRGNIGNFGAQDVILDAEWYLGNGGGFGPIGEIFVRDASWTRLREVSLSYSLPRTFAKTIGFDNATIGFTGRNLVLWTQFEGVDPDLNLTGASKGRGLDYFTNPGTRSYIANLNFGF